MAEYICEMDEQMHATVYGDMPIVRCRNCKNYRPAEDDEHEDGCALAYAYLFETSPDGFCAWGEPREGERR
ncbi:MAG TPA: hypothetical protein IAC01_02670 [Candidatus Limicola stercorigallinarum]|nr:hypothetical protein [Candidatus Limicola stercorigallinarum]